MTANTYTIEKIESIRNKRYRKFFLKHLLEEGKSMEIRSKNVLGTLWISLTSKYSGYTFSSEEISTVLSALFYMHTSILAETLCVVGTFLDNLEWPEKEYPIRKEDQSRIICKFTHGIISGLVSAMWQYTRDLSINSTLAQEKRVAIFIVELLYRQASLELDIVTRWTTEKESPNVHYFENELKDYLLPDSKFVEKKLRPQLLAKEMQKRQFVNVTCKPAKKVLDQILQASFSAIEDYNLRTALVCRGLK
jgi:hypothetical protein